MTGIYNTKTLYILIACDIEEERRAIIASIKKLNLLYFLDKRILLEPVLWENDNKYQLNNKRTSVIIKRNEVAIDLMITVLQAKKQINTYIPLPELSMLIELYHQSRIPVHLYHSQRAITRDKTDLRRTNAITTLLKKNQLKKLVQPYKSIRDFEKTVLIQLITIVDHILASHKVHSHTSLTSSIYQVEPGQEIPPQKRADDELISLMKKEPPVSEGDWSMVAQLIDSLKACLPPNYDKSITD